MKKTIYSVLSLVVAVVLLFSGCTPLSLLKKGEQTTQTTTQPETIYNTETQIAQEYETQIETQNNTYCETTSPTTTVSTATSTTQKTSRQASATTTTTKQNKQNITTTKPITAVQATTKTDLSNLSVKEIQDLLFETEDPNVAGKILTTAGFEYDPEQGIYYAQIDPLQRLFGYNVIYDTIAPRVGMVYSTKRIYFNYNEKDWMIQIWKGQYGITAGAEIGLYNKPEDRAIAQYDCAKDDELITMKFDFYNAGQYEFTRGPEKHWWLTGFKILQVGIGPLIDLDITLEFPNRKMSNAFEEGLKDLKYTNLVDKLTYTRHGNTFNIEW